MRNLVVCGQKVWEPFVLACDQKRKLVHLPSFVSGNVLKCVVDTSWFHFGNVERSKNVACKHWETEICSPVFWLGCALDNEELEIAIIRQLLDLNKWLFLLFNLIWFLSTVSKAATISSCLYSLNGRDRISELEPTSNLKLKYQQGHRVTGRLKWLFRFVTLWGLACWA